MKSLLTLLLVAPLAALHGTDYFVGKQRRDLGMGEGLTIQGSPRSAVRHCVFDNHNIRALSLNGDSPDIPVIPATSPHARARDGKPFGLDPSAFSLGVPWQR